MVEGFDYVHDSFTATASTAHSKIQNAGYDGVVVVADVTAVDTADADETYEFQLQGWDPVSDTWYTIATTGDVAGDGVSLHRLRVHPALTEAANEKISDIIPEYIRVNVALGGTSPSITYTLRIEMV